MARMSVDDSVLRDPRVLLLSKLCGWSRRETIGALLDVWAICYDRVTSTISAMIIDAAADLSGFANHMVESELAKHAPKGRVRVSGVEARITYLEAKAEAGRRGGMKSGETRREKREAKSKQTRSTPQALLNLPDSALVPDPVPDSALVPDPVPDSALVPDPVPDGDPSLVLASQEIPVPLWQPVLVLDEREKLKRELVANIGPAHAKAFARVKQALGSTAMGPSVVDKFEQLRELIDGMPSLEGIQQRCEHAIAVQERDALQKRTMQHFGPGMWKLANFEKALTFELAGVNISRQPAISDRRAVSAVGRVEPGRPEDYPDGEIEL